MHLHPRGGRNNDHARAVGDGATLDDFRGGAQVLDAGVGAGAEEDRVDLDVAQRGAGLEVHVLHGALGGEAVVVVGEVLQLRDGFCQRQALAGVGTPGDERSQGGAIDVHDGVELRVVVGAQGLPVLHGCVPVLALRRVRAAFEVIEGGLVGGDHARAGAGLDGHVAHGHAGFHGQLLDGLAAVLDDVALAAAGADLGDDGQDQVLGGHARLQFAGNLDGHCLEGFQRQGLGGQHVLDLAGADAHGDGAEGAVGGGVRVATDDGHAGLGQAQLRSNGVDDALFNVAHGVQANAELFGVVAQGGHLQAAGGLLDLLQVAGLHANGGDVVVLGGDGQIRAADLAAGLAQAVERLGRGDLVHQVQVDVQQVGAAVFSGCNDVVAPDFFRES